MGMGHKFTKGLLLGATVLATGCATTAKGKSQSSFSSNNSASQSLQKTAPKGTVMAVVRYPAYVEPDARDAYYDAFGKSAIGGKVAPSKANSPEAQSLAEGIILKSNYFALSLFKELAAKLPPHSVLLSPHKVTLGPNGELTSEPMTAAETLPNVVSVDFASYTFPDYNKMMGKEPLTFGDLVTPLVTVRTDHRAAVPTQGVLLASQPILKRAAANGRKTVEADLTAMQNGRLTTDVPELDFITHLKKTQSFDIAAKPANSRTVRNAARAYPLEKIKLNKEALQNIQSGKPGSSDPLQASFSKGFANQIVSIINQTDVDKASMAGRAEAISQFDESLAALTLVGSDRADYQARIRYAERLLEAEQKYLSVQSLRLFDGVHNGEMGAQVRDMLTAEYSVLQKRRKLAHQQNAATALSILGAVVAGGAIINDTGAARSLGEQMAMNALIQGVIVAGTQAAALSRQSKAYGSNYLTSVVPALEEQTSIQVDLIDSNETITAIRFEDLKAKLQSIYAKNQRSLDTVATRCAYTHDGSIKSGTWLGVCQNGLANGSGVGVLRYDDGSAVEYYGYASNGQPQGPGYMIHHGRTSSYALEGNFTSGKADGVMRVTKPGIPDSHQNYSQGVSTGSAPSGARHVSPFTSPPPSLTPS